MRLVCPVAVLFFALSPCMFAGDYVARVVIWDGDPAPTADPPVETFSPGEPSINDNGDVLFLAFLKKTGAPSRFSYWLSRGGTNTFIADEGQTLPNSTLPISYFYDAWLDQEGRVLLGTVSGGTSETDLTVWENGTLRSIERIGKPLFAGDYNVRKINDTEIRFNSGRTLFVAIFDTENLDTSALIIDDRGTLQQLARAYTGTAPGAPDARPLGFSKLRLNTPGHAFVTMDLTAVEDGELLKLNGQDSNEAYYFIDGENNFKLLARRYQSIGAGKILAGINDVSINAFGDIAFIGNHTDGTQTAYKVFAGIPLAFLPLISTGAAVGAVTVGSMSGIQMADFSGDVMVGAIVAGPTTVANSRGVLRWSPGPQGPTREILAYETAVAPSPVQGQTFHYQGLVRASMNREGHVAIDAVLQEKPVADAITNHVLYIENPVTRQMEVAATPGQAISHSQGADVLVRLNSFSTIFEGSTGVVSGSGEDGGHSYFNLSRIHVLSVAARTRTGFGIATVLRALVVNDVGDESDADLTDDVPDVDPTTEGNQLTLRAAIENANKRPGRDTIVFDIPAEYAVFDGRFSIEIETPLPEITEAVEIDATTQPVFAGAPVVSVNGGVKFLFALEQPAPVSKGLVLNADNCSIRGLTFQRFPGPAIEAHGTHEHTLTDNYFGADIDFHVFNEYGNRIGILLDQSGNNKISGNVIAANGIGIQIEGQASDKGINLISNNRIGVERAGSVENLGNFFCGIKINRGDGNVIENNIVCWNGSNTIFRNMFLPEDIGGIVISGTNSAPAPLGNVVRQNSIGVGADGFVSPNCHGVSLLATDHAEIGQPGKGNIISGNLRAGIFALDTPMPAAGPPADAGVPADFRSVRGYGIPNIPPLANAAAALFSVVIQSNYIGTDSAGTVAVPNNDGVNMSGCMATLIENNIVSGNTFTGIYLDNSGAPPGFNLIRGNTIGGSAPPLTALPNTDGIHLHVAKINVISENTIVANRKNGIVIIGNGRNTTLKNVIGAPGLGNGEHGILCASTKSNELGAGPIADLIDSNTGYGISIEKSTNCAIGSSDIRSNTAGGVRFDASDECFVDNTTIKNNKGPGITGLANGNNIFLPGSINGNEGLAIDLLGNGVTLNDSNDADGGPNGLQNFPVLDSLVDLSGGSYLVAGRLFGLPDTLYIIDFYDSPVADPTGHGEGETRLLPIIIATDTAGFARFSTTLFVAPLSNLSAFATQLANPPNFRSGTSEFSLAIKPILAGVDVELVKAVATDAVKVNSPIEVNLTVTNRGLVKATNVFVEGVLNAGFKIASFTGNVGAADKRTSPAFGYAVGDLETNASATLKLTLIPIKAGVLTQVLNARANEGDYKPSDNHVEVGVFAYSTDPVSGNLPPTLVSAISATPNPTWQFGPVTFNALATDPENQTLSYLWNFGDDTDSVVTSADETVHRFTAAGTFTAKLTCFDSSGAAVEGTVMVFVTALGGGTGDNDGDTILNADDPDDDNDGVPDVFDNDIDGDSVPDIVELDASSDPSDKLTFPASADNDGDGIPNGLDPDVDNDGILNDADDDLDGDEFSNRDEELAGTDPLNKNSKPGAITISKLSASLRFDFAGKDQLQVTGQFPGVSSNALLAGTRFVLTAGGSTHTFVLDAKGKAKSATTSASVAKPKAAKGAPNTIGPATFQIKAKGALANELLAGVTLTPVPTSVPLKFIVQFGNQGGLTTLQAVIAVKNGKTGAPASAKLANPR